MLTVKTSNQFEKNVILCLKRGYDIEKLKTIISKLANNQALEASNHVHKLQGKYKNHWECHIEHDWILIYKIDLSASILKLENIGTHADLF
jgi:mRNA interferase YafQ